MNNLIPLNKVYICSTNLTGKAYLLQLLDGHERIAVFPYHKFGVSCSQERFISEFSAKKYSVNRGLLNYDSEYAFKIKNPKNNKIHDFSIGELVSYILKDNGSIPFLIQSHYTKFCTTAMGDLNITKVPFDFNFTMFIDLIGKFIIKINSDEFTIEQIEDVIFRAYIKSVNQYFKKAEKNPIYAQVGANGIEQIDNLFKYYDNFKILFLKRDPIAINYANSKRVLSKGSDGYDINRLYNVMISSVEGQKKKYFSLVDQVNKYTADNSRIMVIDFEELINDTSDVMKKVSYFLNIEFSEKLGQPTIIGEPIEFPGLIDDPYRELSNKQIRLMKYFYFGMDSNALFDDKYQFMFEKFSVKVKHKLASVGFIRNVYKVLKNIV